MDLDQQMQLTEEEDLRDLLMIGGIQVFLPFSREEAKIYVVGVTIIEGKLAETVKEELEQISKAAREKEENENSKEWLNSFSQEAKRNESATLKLTAEEAKEQAYRLLTPWEIEL
jgi:hypothetical protein